MTRHEQRWLRAPALTLLIAATLGCASSGGLSGNAVPMNERPPAGGRESGSLYVVPLDSLLTLAEGTPVHVVLRNGGRVFGTSLRSSSNSPAEFHVRAPARRLFDPPDTVQMPIGNIEVVVSAVDLTGDSQPYVGRLAMGSLPRAEEGFADPMRHVVVALTVVAILGAFALLGALVAR